MNEIDFYDEIGNWNFDDINRDVVKITDWDFYKEIEKNTNEKSLCLDLGTGGGEKLLKNYPDVGMVIGTDLSEEMIKTAQKNAKDYPNKKVKFVKMDNLQMTFPSKTFDLISARHTIIDAKQLFEILSDEGTIVIQGIDKLDCIEIKEVFQRGQGFKDEIAISDKDYNDLKKAGFTRLKRVEIFEDEYYKTEKDLMALLLKTPILDEYSEVEKRKDKYNLQVEKKLFDEYVKKYKTEKGILLKRRLYGIVAKK